MTVANKLSVFFCLLCPLFFLGCGGSSSDDGLITISGTVSYQGEPVPDGFVTFLPSDSGQASQAGSIKDGAYTAQLEAMNYNVIVEGVRESADKLVPDSSGEAMIPAVEAYTPEKYLSAETSGLSITASPDNTTYDITLED